MLPENTYNYSYCVTFENTDSYVIYSQYPLLHKLDTGIHSLINSKDEDDNNILTWVQLYKNVSGEWIEQEYTQSDSISYIFIDETLWANYNLYNEDQSTLYFTYISDGTLSLGQILDKDYNYSLALVNSGTKEIIAYLPEASVNYKPIFKDISELEFTVPYLVNNIENPNFSKIKNNYMVLLQKKINNTVVQSEYYIIKKINLVDNDTSYKQIYCYSYEYTLNKKVIRGFKDVRKLYDPDNNFDFNDITKGGIINYILEHKLYNTWTVNYISSSLLNIYRNFDISESGLIEVIRDCESQFNCIFEFDTYNKQINIKSIDEIGENKGLIISDVNLLKSISENINTDSIITRLYIYGKDGLSIASVNPQGDYIDNFDTFRNTTYMSQDLLDAFDDYDDLVNSQTTEFNIRLEELTNINNNINYANSELQEFNSQLDIIKQNIQICYDTSDNINLVGSAESIYRYNDIIFDGTEFILSTNDGVIVNGLTTFTRNSYKSPYSINKIAHSNDLSTYVLVNDMGYIYYSSDKINWNIFRFDEPKKLNSICFGNGVFVAVGDNGIIRTSINPSTSWSITNLGESINLKSVIWDSTNSLFIAVGDNGIIYTSSNGTSWNSITTAYTVDLHNICSNESIIVTIGYNGQLLTSTDGVNWIKRNIGTLDSLYGICWTGTIFVIVGTNGKILTSLDGINWTSRTSGLTNNLYSVCFGNSEIIVVGDGEVSITSVDGVTWTQRYILGNNYSTWATKKIFKQSQINSKESEISILETNKINKQNSINDIYESLKYENNFTSSQLDVIVDYLNEERVTITSSDVDELKLFAQEYLAWKSQPIIEFEIDIQDIFSLQEYQYNWEKIKIGDLIYLDFSKFGVSKYEVRLISYTHSIDNNSLQLVFSNKNMIDDDDTYINKILNNMRKPCTDVNIERDLYKDYQNNKADITNFIYGSTIDTSDKAILTNGNKITEYGLESITDDDYELVITKNKIIMVKKDGTEYYSVVSPNGLASSAVNRDRIVIDYNGLNMYNSSNQQHGICMDKTSINQYADFKLKYNGNTTFEIYNAIDNIVMKFFNSSVFSYSAPDKKIYGLGNHDYQLCNITNTVKHLTQAEALAKTDWLENQLVEITDEELPLIVDDLSSSSTITDIALKINQIIQVLKDLDIVRTK